jgi:hypothetical protein
MKVIIDRFEGDYAIIELSDLLFVDVPRVLFPNAEEGDVIEITIDKSETDKRRKKIQGLVDELFID